MLTAGSLRPFCLVRRRASSRPSHQALVMVQGEESMSKILSTAVVAGLQFAITAPAFAADTPKTKADRVVGLCDRMRRAALRGRPP
jgi:hypothetical protein